METLEEAIFWLAPKFYLVHECLGLGKFAEIAITSDGDFVARARGDCGFNYFFGKPSESTRLRAWDLFMRLSDLHRMELIRRLHARGIPPQALGIPEPTD